MSWTLTIDGTERTLADWGISHPQLTRVSLNADRFEGTLDGWAVNAAPLFNYGATITVKRNDTVRFRGVIVTVPRQGRGGVSERHSFTAEGAWRSLERTVLQQSWQTKAGTEAQYKSRAILGETALGESQTVATVCAAIVDYAIACGAPLSRAAFDLPMYAPAEEFKDVTCAEALRKVLRMVPDVVGWMVYGEGNPVLHLARRAALEEVTVTAAEAVDFTALPELQVPSVVIKYEIANTVDDQVITDLIVDAAPADADGREEGALVQTIPIKGMDVAYARMKVRTRAIETDVTNAESADGLKLAKRYWAAMIETEIEARIDPDPDDTDVPNMSFHLVDSVGLPGVYIFRRLARPTGKDGEGEYEDPEEGASEAEKTRVWRALNPSTAYAEESAREARLIRLDDSLPRELLEGLVCPWMVGVKAQKQTFVMLVTYTSKGVEHQLIPFQISITATDAVTRTYSAVEQVTDAETITLGLAEVIYDALGRLQHAGTAEKVQTECTGFAGPGNRLTISDLGAALAGMSEPIQESVEDIDNGTTTLRFGPPGHLSIPDFCEMVRMQRRQEGNTGQRTSNNPQRLFGYA